MSRRQVAVGILAAELLMLAGCGGSSSTTANTTPPKAANRAPSRGFASTGAYSFVHAHLRVHQTLEKAGYGFTVRADCFKLPAGFFPYVVDWAQPGVRDGYCLGDYEGTGSNKSLDGRQGFSEWHYDERGIHIRQGVNLSSAHADFKPSRPWIECDVADRGTAECYTNDSERGKSKGSEGGPFDLYVQTPGHWENNYILLRGWCAMSDINCNAVGPLQ
jgi:hypothetical protein